MNRWCLRSNDYERNAAPVLLQYLPFAAVVQPHVQGTCLLNHPDSLQTWNEQVKIKTTPETDEVTSTVCLSVFLWRWPKLTLTNPITSLLHQLPQILSRSSSSIQSWRKCENSKTTLKKRKEAYEKQPKRSVQILSPVGFWLPWKLLDSYNQVFK